MGIEGLQFQTFNLPFASGLDTGGDPRAAQPPALDICQNLQFDDLGGLQLRHPYAALGASIFGGGTLANVRKIVENGDELLCFTADSLYSWNSQLAVWVLKGTHLAIKVAEQDKFSTTGDQHNADRAELAGTVVYAWEENTQVWVAASDKTTGSVLMAPTLLAALTSRPRLVALSTKILLIFNDDLGANLKAIAIDPATPATAVAGAFTTLLASPNYNLYYDVVKQPGADTALVGVRRTTTTSYSLLKVTAALVVTASTKARTCDGPIAVSCEPTGTSVQVVRGNGTNIEGDMITISTLADVYTAQAVGTAAGTVNQIAVCHRSVQDSGTYRCYAFWSSAESTITPGFLCKTNWVSTSNTLGTQATLSYDLGVASRAFDYGGRIYVWGVFAQPAYLAINLVGTTYASVQNCYFLYRDDGFLCAKSASGTAGGFSALTGRLSGVYLTSGSTSFTWCGAQRRVIPLTRLTSDYTERTPLEVTVTFDSNEARRTARIGRTLYVTGGEILQYDGVRLTEVGFHVTPYSLTLTQLDPGNIAAGTYSYKGTLRWLNAAGESERSTTYLEALIALSGATAPYGVSLVSFMIHPTHKTAGTNLPAYEYWRTVANEGEPFYRVTSRDPSDVSNPNRYDANDTTTTVTSTVNDELADESLSKREANDETSTTLQDLAPPAATLILSTRDRIFLAGIAGYPDQVRYSKQRLDGRVAAFNDALSIDIPLEGGAITALAFFAETLIVFRQRAIYAFNGDGFDNVGGGQNYGLSRTISKDIGAIVQESVVQLPLGVLFKTSKGWYRLSPQWDVHYVGSPVKDFDGDTVLAAHCMTTQHQVRIVTDSRVLVFDYRANEWAEWTIASALDACLWNGAYVYLASSGPKIEVSTYVGVDYGWDVEFAWFKPAELQGRFVALWIQMLAEYRSDHRVRVRIARNYEQDGGAAEGAGSWVYFDDKTWSPPVAKKVVAGPEQLRHGPSKKRMEAIKVRLSTLGPGTDPAPSGEGARLTGLALRLGLEQTPFAGLAASQRQ